MGGDGQSGPAYEPPFWSLPGTGLDATALVTAYRWRFEPAVKGGVAVPTFAHAPVTFRID